VGNAAEDFIGEKPVVLQDRYMTIDGCVRHMCPELEGFLWIDTASAHSDIIFAALVAIPNGKADAVQLQLFHLWVFSSRPTSQSFMFENSEFLPDMFLYPLQDWFDKLSGRRIASVMFVGSDGRMKPLLPSALHLSGDSGQPHEKQDVQLGEQ